MIDNAQLLHKMLCVYSKDQRATRLWGQFIRDRLLDFWFLQLCCRMATLSTMSMEEPAELKQLYKAP
jgi:hypothetical protein